MDTQLGRIHRSSVAFLLRVYSNPAIPLAATYVAFFVPFAILPRFLGLFVGLLVSFAVGYFLWVAAVAAASSWEGVLVSAKDLGRKQAGLAEVRFHVSTIKNLLEVSVGDLVDDLLTVGLSGELLPGQPSGKADALAITLQAIKIDLARKVLQSSVDERTAFFHDYAAGLEESLRESPTPEGGTVLFLISRFRRLGAQIKAHARRWEPPPSIWERIEMHKTLFGAVLTMLFLTVLLLSVSVYHVPVSISP